jgi:hypothetical protein
VEREKREFSTRILWRKSNMLNLRESSAKSGLVLLLATIIMCFSNESAYAYADPGTAGLLYQIVIIIFASCISYFLFLKDFVKGLFKGKPEKQPKETEQQD